LFAQQMALADRIRAIRPRAVFGPTNIDVQLPAPQLPAYHS
jgi:hypothetical protein